MVAQFRTRHYETECGGTEFPSRVSGSTRLCRGIRILDVGSAMLQERTFRPVGLAEPRCFEFLRAAEKMGLPASAFEIRLFPTRSGAEKSSRHDEVSRIRITRQRTSKTRTYSNSHGEWLYWALQDLRNGVFN